MPRRTKIVATLGPATASEEMVEALIRAGMDVARVNFSHSTRAEHAAQIQTVRRVAERLGRPVAVLQDLQGPKIRLGKVQGGAVEIAAGDTVTLTPDDGTPGTAARLGVSLDDLGRQLPVGTAILIDDGRLRLRVVAVEGAAVRAQVEVGGPVSDHKGVNVPNASLDVPVLTAKDLDDLAFGVEVGVDFVALSFVRSAGDVRLLRDRLVAAASGVRAGGPGPDIPRIVAKIEKHEALREIDAVIDQADGVMVARGDLGVEIPPRRCLTTRRPSSAKPWPGPRRSSRPPRCSNR
ncbi:MAG: pyruvate kinase [Thermoleophilia bacterium]|nr:pyruvate kinase [Thermoleophilia bacterium]